MILPLPIRFDANEWYILINSTCGYLWLFFSPKRFPHSISVLLVLFCVSAAIIYDHAIAGPPLDWYNINDYTKYELFDVFTYFMYAPYALLCVYLYDKFKPKGLWFTAYIVLWSLLCVGFEWLAMICHVFKFHKWSLVYSFSVYLIMTSLYLRLFEYLLRKFHSQSASSFPSKRAE
ncbi:MAG: hypothetical protein JWR03_382 [Cohnella sp.]|nr:hypothetical protein [Cohnella sp.]